MDNLDSESSESFSMWTYLVRACLCVSEDSFPSRSLSAWLQIPLPTESFHQLVHIDIFRKLRLVLSSYLLLGRQG